MALTAGVAAIWHAQLLEKFRRETAYSAAFTNRNYEGEIKGHGDTVHVLSIGGITVDDYTGADISYEDLSQTGTDLVINQAKYFAFKVDDVDEQKNIIDLVSAGSVEAGDAIGQAKDIYLGSLHAGVAAANQYGSDVTPIVIGGGSGEVAALDALQEFNQRLDEADIPRGNRRVVLPPWFVRRLQKELGNRATQLGDTVTTSGQIGTVEGLQIWGSNNVPNTTATKYKILAGLPVITYADAIAKVETLRLQESFKSAVRGLYLFGAKMMKPTAMALGTFNKGDLTA